MRVSTFLLPLALIGSVRAGGAWTWLGLLWITVFNFLIEKLVVGMGWGREESAPAAASAFFGSDIPLYLYGALHFVALFYLLAHAEAIAADSAWSLVGVGISFGAVMGAVGGTALHEFSHRRERIPAAVSALIGWSLHLSHFRVAHLRGHHRHVGLARDASTARRGESLYAFLLRAGGGGLVGAWRIETERLRRRGFSAVSPRNEVLRGWLIQVLVDAAILLAFGGAAFALWLAVSLLGAAIVEGTNYVSHYGLERATDAADGEATLAEAHSWECRSKVTNWFFYNAGRHPAHHRAPRTPHVGLTASTGGMPMPHALSTMLLLSFVPPLFRRAVHPVLDRWHGPIHR